MTRWLSWLCILVAGVAEAEIPFVHLDVEDGLSHNSVYAIAQDQEGFIWFGTADGLNRFDGYEFRVYRQGPEGSGTLRNNSISALLLDDAGRLWVGTEDGINRYLPESDSFRRYDTARTGGAPGHGRITVLHQDPRGVIRAGTGSGLLRYDPELDRFRVANAFSGPGAALLRSIAGIQDAPDGSVWCLGTVVPDRMVLERLQAGMAPERYELMPAWSFAAAFLIDASGRFWTHYRDHGVFQAGSLSVPAAPASEGLTAAAEMEDGSLWFGSADGLYLREAETNGWRHEYVDPEDRSWLRNYVRVIFEDATGSVWIGTYTGIYRYDPGARPFRRLGHDPNDPRTLSGSAVSAIAGDRSDIWVGAFGGGITHIDTATGEVRYFRHDPEDEFTLPGDVVWDLLKEERTIWVGTDDGLARLDAATGRTQRIPGTGGQKTRRVAYILRGLDGALWLATGLGLIRYDSATGHLQRFPVSDFSSEPSNATSDAGLSVLWQQNESTLWIGTDGGHLNRLDIESGTFRHFLLTDGDERFTGEGVWDLLPAADGVLWVAHGGGLYRFDTATGEGENLGIADGLAGSIVYAVSADQRDHLWLGTNHGLARLDPRTGRIRNYTTRDGLANMEFNRHADWRSSDGELYFGGTDGLTWFHPDDVEINRNAPPVVLTELSRYGADRIETVHPLGLEQLIIGPGDYGFSVRFAALNFVNPAQNRYAYRLTGLEERWISVGNSRLARYTNLDPGHYRFEVRGSNNDGVWSTRPARLEIRVVPAFWETGWFYGGVLLLAAALLYGAYRYRLGQIRRLEQVRLRIASDLHDDVSSDLSGIAVAADMITTREGLTEKDRNLLSDVAATARSTSSALRDVVWYINPEQDTLAALVDRLRSTSNALLASHDRRFIIQMERPEHHLSMELRRNVLLIYKETLHNILRHARAERVDIEILEAGGLLRILVTDDGIGFEPGSVRGGLGTANMRRRAAGIGAEFSLWSKPGCGTRMRLAVGITDSRDGTSRGPGLGLDT